MDNKRFYVVIAIIIVGFIGIVAFNGGNKGGADEAASNTKGSNNVYGKADSAVTLTEFVDFQCEACYAYYPAVKQVKETYKDRVRFEIRNFPIVSGHQFATQAARSAEAAARQGKFFEMHDKIFEGQKMWERTTDPQPTFNQYAKDIGLDMTKFETDRRSDSVNAVINKDLKDVEALGGDGTPTFVLNGKKIESPGSTVEDLSKVLDDALAKAEQE